MRAFTFAGGILVILLLYLLHIIGEIQQSPLYQQLDDRRQAIEATQ